MNRDERRELAERIRAMRKTHRVITVTRICPECSTPLGATFFLRKNEPDPLVIFVHKADGTHGVGLSGDSDAARSLLEMHEVGRIEGTGLPHDRLN